MSLSLIKGALENAIISVTPNIATEYENVPFTPVAGTPYQSLYFMPSINIAEYINEKSYMARGIFQITLSYPSNKGTADVMARANLYMDKFHNGATFTNQGQKVQITGVPDVVRLGNDGDRYRVAVSVEWRCLVNIV
jgi:hypothetical protein